MSLLSLKVAEIKAENEKDVKYIIKGLREDGYTTERLNLLLEQAEQYEKKHGGSRGNRNVIEAVKQLLSEKTLSF
jgi:hypothetical protein